MGHFSFKLPDLGEGIVESEVVDWHVKPGDQITEDQHIADVMTDKATVELSSPVNGTVLKVACDAGEILAVGSELVLIEVEGKGNVAAAAVQPQAEAAPVESPVAEVTSEPQVQEAGRYSFKLPDLGEGIVESEIVDWHVKVGDQVTEDQHIVDVMTDKATVELSAPVSGTVVSIACDAGDVLAVGAELINFAVAEGAGNTSAKVVQETPAANAPVQTAAPVTADPAATATASAPRRSAGGPVLASPSVRQRARDEDIDLSVVPGSGPAGRISHKDLDSFIAAGGHQATAGANPLAPRTATSEVKVRGLRRVIAQKMVQSKRNIPHYSYVEEIDVTALEDLRKHLNENRKEGQEKLTLLPFIVQALVKALPEFPHCNARYDDQAEVLTQYEGVHVGIATMTTSGLMVPVIRHSETLDIWAVAAELKRLTMAAREGVAQSSELTGSTVTITSLGAIGGIASTPVINAPETSIIGVNKLQERPVVKDGEIVVRKMMNLSSSFDHRIVDGYDGAMLVQALKRLLENPASIFV